MVPRLPRAFCIALVLALGVLHGAACDPSIVGIDACRQIEQARCESAPACGIDLAQPVHRGDTPADAVAACTRYYKDACLHGLSTTVEPQANAVQSCVDVIVDPKTSCDVVRNPQIHPSCAFLTPPAPPVAANTTDAASDASAE
jgi:hypothetical protein